MIHHEHPSILSIKVQTKRKLFPLAQIEAEIAQLQRIDRRGRVHHQIRPGGRFREGDHVADRLFSGEQHDDPIQSQPDAAMRRRAIFECFHQETETLEHLLDGTIHRLQHALLNIAAMNADAAAAQLHAVQHQVV